MNIIVVLSSSGNKRSMNSQVFGGINAGFKLDKLSNVK